MPSSDVGSPIPPNEPTISQGCQPVQTSVEMPYRSPTNLDQNGFYRPATYESNINSQWGTGPSGYLPQNTYNSNAPSGLRPNRLCPWLWSPSTPGSLGSPLTSQSPHVPSIDYKPSGPVCNEATPLKYDAPALPPSSTSSSSPKAGSTPKDDEPFTFDPAFIAATAVMFRQEVLPAYPELASSYVSSSSSPKRRTSGTAQ